MKGLRIQVGGAPAPTWDVVVVGNPEELDVDNEHRIGSSSPLLLCSSQTRTRKWIIDILLLVPEFSS